MISLHWSALYIFSIFFFSFFLFCSYLKCLFLINSIIWFFKFFLFSFFFILFFDILYHSSFILIILKNFPTAFYFPYLFSFSIFFYITLSSISFIIHDLFSSFVSNCPLVLPPSHPSLSTIIISIFHSLTLLSHCRYLCVHHSHASYVTDMSGCVRGQEVAGCCNLTSLAPLIPL